VSRAGAAWLDGPLAGRRFGVKGPRAAEVLAESGVAVPARANSWSALEVGGGTAGGTDDVIARLGNTEFFIESSGEFPGLAALETRLAAGEPGAYPVLREDFAIVLGGAAAPDVLAQVCNIDFAAVDLAAQPIVMTSMIGVGVLVMPRVADGHLYRGMVYRIWCDPSFGSYLESELGAIVEGSTRKTG
jgi:sarcosine oxidase, subunit gamma